MDLNLNKILILLFSGSFLLNFLITKILIRYSKKLNLIDHPDQRKMHSDSTPVVGGLGIALTMSLIILCFLCTNQASGIFGFNQIVIISISTSIILLTGLMDDSLGLTASNKFLFQLIATLIFLFGFDIQFKPIFSIDSYIITFIFNTLFIVGITNAFNLLDGLDGLAGGVSLIICMTLMFLYYLSGYGIIQIALFVLLSGCLSSFLLFNKPPAKTFLGDTGSLFLGWYFALTSIYFAEKTTLSLSILIPFMVLGLPAFDVLFVMLSRFIKRHNYKISFRNRFKSVFLPDNTHLHHLLVRGGVSKGHTVIFLYVLTLISCITCLFLWINQRVIEINFIYGIIFILLLIFISRLYIEWKIKYRRIKKNRVNKD